MPFFYIGYAICCAGVNGSNTHAVKAMAGALAVKDGYGRGEYSGWVQNLRAISTALATVAYGVWCVAHCPTCRNHGAFWPPPGRAYVHACMRAGTAGARTMATGLAACGGCAVCLGACCRSSCCRACLPRRSRCQNRNEPLLHGRRKRVRDAISFCPLRVRADLIFPRARSRCCEAARQRRWAGLQTTLNAARRARAVGCRLPRANNRLLQ